MNGTPPNAPPRWTSFEDWEAQTEAAENARLLRLVVHASDEAEAVLRLLPQAQSLQFDRSAVRADNETGRKVQGGHSDPTPDVATDGGRLYLRDVLRRAEPHLMRAATDLGGVRRGLERALAAWQDAPPNDDA